MELKKPITLIGLMGAGKTTIGHVLAKKLNVPFLDSDHVIEEKAGVTIPEIFNRDGETLFRKVEAKSIREILEQGKPLVLATGGGAYINEEAREAIKKHATCIWLRASLDTLHQRVEHSGNRPLLQNVDRREVLAKLMKERYPIYEQADIVIDTDSNSRNLIIDNIMQALVAYSLI